MLIARTMTGDALQVSLLVSKWECELFLLMTVCALPLGGVQGTNKKHANCNEEGWLHVMDSRFGPAHRSR